MILRLTIGWKRNSATRAAPIDSVKQRRVHFIYHLIEKWDVWSSYLFFNTTCQCLRIFFPRQLPTFLLLLNIVFHRKCKMIVHSFFFALFGLSKKKEESTNSRFVSLKDHKYLFTEGEIERSPFHLFTFLVFGYIVNAQLNLPSQTFSRIYHFILFFHYPFLLFFREYHGSFK